MLNYQRVVLFFFCLTAWSMFGHRWSSQNHQQQFFFSGKRRRTRTFFGAVTVRGSISQNDFPRHDMQYIMVRSWFIGGLRCFLSTSWALSCLFRRDLGNSKGEPHKMAIQTGKMTMTRGFWGRDFFHFGMGIFKGICNKQNVVLPEHGVYGLAPDCV